MTFQSVAVTNGSRNVFWFMNSTLNVNRIFVKILELNRQTHRIIGGVESPMGSTKLRRQLILLLSIESRQLHTNSFYIYVMFEVECRRVL